MALGTVAMAGMKSVGFVNNKRLLFAVSTIVIRRDCKEAHEWTISVSRSSSRLRDAQ